MTASCFDLPKVQVRPQRWSDQQTGYHILFLLGVMAVLGCIVIAATSSRELVQQRHFVEVDRCILDSEAIGAREHISIEVLFGHGGNARKMQSQV